MEALSRAYSNLKEMLEGLFSFVAVQLANISMTDVFDILIMTIMLMWLYRFVRGRRTIKLMTGILVWMIILALGRLFNLYTISFLFGYIFQAGIVAIVILFQPELRDALERVGEEPLRGLKGFGEGGNLTETRAWIRDISEAVSDMSRSNTGALIVFEGTAQLADVARSGIEVDAKISPYLIRNLFFNNSPLHDGAVLIRKGRVLAAGCLLPLTRRSDIDQDLGTRHRAAIGMSEVSDAIIVVVSEETGKISVARGGKITRGYTAQMLRDMLSDVFLPNREKEEPILAEFAQTYQTDDMGDMEENAITNEDAAAETTVVDEAKEEEKKEESK